MILACVDYHPGGERWRVTDAEDLDRLLASTTVLDELRPGLTAALREVRADVEDERKTRERLADPETPEYAMRAGYWCAALTIVFPILVLPAIAFGFLVARRGRLGAGIQLMVAAGIALWISILLLELVIGGGNSSSTSG